MTVLTTPHERALTLLFSELERSASEQFEVLLGTPGTLVERTNETGTRFWVHRYSDALNRRQEMYLGKVDSPEIERRISTMREMIATANATIARVRLLARAGFATIDRKAYFTLASLHNRGLFRAGALLVGSHAYGALLNALGVRARHKTSSKPEKDLHQAAVLIEALVERYPGAIEDAASAVPKSAARHLTRAIKALEQHLPATAASALDILHAIALTG